MANRTLLWARFALTPFCNFQCEHCYVGARFPNATGRRQLSTVEVESVLTQLSKTSCLFVSITGGEPLLHPDFERIWRHAFRSGLRLNLFTNGSLIDDSHFSLFKECPPHSIQVSLYGHSDEAYRFFTRCRGMSERVLNAIESLCAGGFSVTARFVASNITAKEAKASRNHFSRLPGVRWLPHPVLDPCMSGCGTDPKKIRVGLDESIEMLLDDPDARQQLLNDYDSRSLPRSTEWYHCSAADFSVAIDPFGGYSFCDYSIGDLGLNIRDVDLSTGFNSIIPDWIARENARNRKPSQCMGCAARVFCKNCPQTAKLESGRDGVNDYYHQFACALYDRLRALDTANG